MGSTAERLAVTTALAVAIFAFVAPARGDEGADYLPAIRQELARLALDARCNETTRACAYEKSYPDGAKAHIIVLYSETTRTVYAYVDRFLSLPDPDRGPSIELARALLKLNREMTTAKAEWDEATGSIRLSVTLNTDSNLDRKALRSQLEGLWQVAKRAKPKLEPIIGGEAKTGENNKPVDVKKI